MLHYGHSHPSADYFNSNLMVSNFVVANLISNSSDVFFYDEQAQSKDVDALCSLRFTYHLEKFKTLLSRKIAMPKNSVHNLRQLCRSKQVIACHEVLRSILHLVLFESRVGVPNPKTIPQYHRLGHRVVSQCDER
jgi:hypothetical protein